MLSVCRSCALIFNSVFKPDLVEYAQAYENSLHYSPTFQRYATELADDLASRYDLRGKLVVEVGCGKGEFLNLLCERSGAHGIGIDASYQPDLTADTGPATVRFLSEPFERLDPGIRPDLVYCRHVLEHIPQPLPFIEAMAQAARRRSGSAVFIEVPDVLFSLRDRGVWDVIYEHCLYFSEPSLRNLLIRAGLSVDQAYSTYGGQFLCAHARTQRADDGSHTRMRDASADVAAVVDLAVEFGRQHAIEVSTWRRRLAGYASEGKRVAVWGAGSKGVTFVNSVDTGGVAFLIDLNPRKRNRFVPSTGHKVVAPEDLASAPADVVVVMNPLYRSEVGERLHALGVSARIESV